MKSPEAQTYTDIMAQPFVDGLSTIDGSLAGSEPPIAGMAEAQVRVIERLEQLDWESFCLPDHYFGRPDDQIGEKPLKPKAYANRLTAFAFGDFYDLVSLCEAYIENNPDVSFDLAQALKNSRQELLAISELGDDHKSRIIGSAKHPQYAEVYIDSKLEGQPITAAYDEGGKPFFKWNPVIRHYIDRMKTDESGCPARHKIITTPEGKKHVLINYFWDKLIEAMYG